MDATPKLDATASQFINAIDDAVRGYFADGESVPEQSKVANTYSMFFDAFAGMFAASGQCDKDSVVSELVKKYSTELEIKKRIGFEFKDEESRPWLGEAEESIDWYYWKRYRRYLINDKKWAPAAVKSIDRDSRNVLDLMANPKMQGSFTRRGLVVASVQSGKTANYIGLICRAADAGYKIIIVMAGVHNVLRNQTQARLEDGFTGFNIENRKVEPVGVGKIISAKRPIAFTSRGEDFNTARADALRGIQPAQTNEPLLFVIKKNSNSLKQVYEWLKGSNNQDAPLLLIDDEADNASINGKYKLEKRDNEPTRINGQIRNLLNLFSKASYVGYTATPFANVLIDPSVDSDEYGKDLFPSNFIYTLEESTDYFGAKKVFGDYDEATQKHLRFIEDADDILPIKHKSDFAPLDLPLSLKAAVRTFILATTIRSLRIGPDFNSTMMVNASPYTKPQNCIRNRLEDYLGELCDAAKTYGALSPKEALRASEHLRALKDTFEREYSDCELEWGDLQPHIYDPRYRVLSINSNSGDSLDYEHVNERVIAVGGYRLSRGLTLEGLIVSYYSRNAKAYDALMQMARWFGYRPGYEDLCRVWMTDQAAGWYKFVADTTENLFDQLRSMRQEKRTPKNYVLKIRQSPDALTVTARNKMGAGQKEQAPLDLNEGFVETYTFDRDRDIVAANKAAVCDLLDKIACFARFEDDGPNKFFYRNVPVRFVTDFLNTYETELSSLPKAKTALSYIDDRLLDGELEEWDVLLAHGSQSNDSVDLPIEDTVYMEQRYPGDSSSEQVIYAGNKHRLSSRGVEAAGLTPEERKAAEDKYASDHDGDGASNCSDLYYRQMRKRALLVLHPVCIRFSKRQIERKHRDGKRAPVWWESWEAQEVVFGWSISFPHTDKQTNLVTYVFNSAALHDLVVEPEDSDDDYDDD